MRDIYKEIILDHYRNPRNFGQIKKPTKTSVVFNPLCGDKIEIDILIDKEKIKDIRFRGKGCVISQAAASMLTDYVRGKSKNELKKINKKFIMKMLGIELGPNRIKCALLPLEAIRKII